jgi:hypothetical protein
MVQETRAATGQDQKCNLASIMCVYTTVTGVIEDGRNPQVTLQSEVPWQGVGKKRLTVSLIDVCFAVVLFQVDFATLNTTVRPQTSAPAVTFDFNQSERSSR